MIEIKQWEIIALHKAFLNMEYFTIRLNGELRNTHLSFYAKGSKGVKYQLMIDLANKEMWYNKIY